MKIDSAILRQCWFLAGPTATGKTSLALHVATHLRAAPPTSGEIVGMDSMSLYRGMDIGTAKPTPEERARVPHHLIDFLEPHEEFSVADYVRAAEAAARDILQRDRVPLFVGGTGLYLRSLLRGVFEGPGADPEFRQHIEAQAAAHAEGWLHQQVEAVDPVAAARLHPNDQRRLVRALEVHHLTGRPASQQQAEGPLPLGQRPQHVHWLSPPRAWLYERINSRVQQMIDAGWVDEVRRLLELPRPLSRTASQALGYQELSAHIRGECSLTEAVERIQTRTRQFAKRQHTWFRNLEECRAVEITGTETPQTLADRLPGLEFNL